MDTRKTYLLAELTVLPEFLDEVESRAQASTDSYPSRGRL